MTEFLSPTPFLLSSLACPDDQSPVIVSSHQQVGCPRCGRIFNWEDGILEMLPLHPSWSSTELQEAAGERAQRDLEASRYDALLGLRLLSPLEIPATLQPLHLGAADRVLEVGCGTGRFTLPLASRCRELLAVDHSLESLRVLRRKLPTSIQSSVLLVQGDATRLPVQTGWATRALSCQMLEHLPSEEMRERAVSELARCLGAGGRIALSGYWFAPLLRWLLPREGKHSGAIYFHRFTRSEFQQLLDPYFLVERISSRLVYILLAHGRKRDG